jgi:hypothetical protein
MSPRENCCNLWLEFNDLISQPMRGKPLYIHLVYKLQCTSVHLVPTKTSWSRRGHRCWSLASQKLR